MKYLDLSKKALNIFNESVTKYHLIDKVDQKFNNPYSDKSLSNLLYKKNWIDTVQWHLEDIIRDPNIEPAKGLILKRRIDHSNQQRTDLVEKIDDYYLALYKNITPSENAKLNTESPGWVVDRLSILCLKIYHMQEQVNRKDTDKDHIYQCESKLDILIEQMNDLSEAFNELLFDIENGRKKIKVYRQMKMYNDASLNPVLYKKDID